MTTTKSSKITGFNFTFALTGGAWIRRENGDNTWESFAQIEKEMGHTFVDYMLNKQGSFTGCEVSVTDDDLQAIADDCNESF
jgi:hypothetical protein